MPQENFEFKFKITTAKILKVSSINYEVIFKNYFISLIRNFIALTNIQIPDRYVINRRCLHGGFHKRKPNWGQKPYI